MKFLYDFFPLLLFFAAYKYYDIYTATAVAIGASFVQVGLYWLKHRRFETMHLVTLGAIAIFGGLTLLLRDDTFIKWKPTIVYWILTVLVLGSHFVGQRTMIHRVLSTQIALPQPVWNRLNLSWGIFFLLLGGLNLYIAFFYGLDLDEVARQDIWVNFKVFGLLGLTFVFILAQAVYMARHMNTGTKAGDPAPEKAAD
jgi:intracellular septation protein